MIINPQLKMIHSTMIMVGPDFTRDAYLHVIKNCLHNIQNTLENKKRLGGLFSQNLRELDHNNVQK